MKKSIRARIFSAILALSLCTGLFVGAGVMMTAWALDANALTSAINNITHGGSGTLSAITTDSNTVTVTGTVTDATEQNIKIEIPNGITVDWQADYTGTYGVSIVAPYGSEDIGGTFQISAGGKLASTGTYGTIKADNVDIIVKDNAIITGVQDAISMGNSSSSSFGAVTIEGGLVESIGASGHAIAANPVAAGEHGAVTVNGGIVKSANGCAIVGGNITVAGGEIIAANNSNSPAINAYGDIYISNGKITSDTVRAITSNGESNINISGGIIESADGIALEVLGKSNISISGTAKIIGKSNGVDILRNAGSVSLNISGTPTIINTQRTNSAIAIGNGYHGNVKPEMTNCVVNISGGTIYGESTALSMYEVPGSTISITGGVFAHGIVNDYSVTSPLSIDSTTKNSEGYSYSFTNGAMLSKSYNGYNYMNTGNGIGNASPTANAVTIAWNKPETAPEFQVGDVVDALKTPDTTVAMWDTVGGVSGISYSYSTNSGFIPVYGVTVTQPGPTANELGFTTMPSDVTYGIDITPPSGAPKTDMYGAITVYYIGTGSTNYAKSTSLPTDAGTYNVLIDTTGTNDVPAYSEIKIGSFTISRAALTITGVTAATRAYDGTTTIALSGGELQDVLTADKTGDGAVGFVLGIGAVESPSAGTSKAVVTNITLIGAKSTNYILTQPADITVDISKAAGPAAPASVTGSYTGDGTTFTYTIDATEGAEYSKDNTAWQESPAFGGFTTDTPETTFYARIKETENYLPGAAGDTGAVTFLPLTGPAAPALGFAVSGGGFPKTVTIAQLPGAEYSFDGDSYSATNTYASTDAEDVTLYIRIAATATHNASEPSTAAINTANQNQDAPEAFELEAEAVDDASYTVTIPPTAGAEYSFDGVTWSDAAGANIKTGGLPGETVTGYKRFAAKEGYNISPSVSASVTLPLFQVKTPAATPDGGAFTNSVSVTLSSATADASIYYTTDGNAPTNASTLYVGAFTLTETTTLKAIAVKAGMRDSEVLTAAFTKQAAPPIIDVGPSGSSSSSDASKTAPAADGSVSVSYTQTGGAVTVSLPDGKVTELISKSSGTASIDLSKISNATSASLPSSALEALADAKLAVELKLPQGAITLEAAGSVAAQSGESRVSVGIKAVAAASLNAAQREAISDFTVYDISISSGNKQITGFGGASAIIELPYTLKEGETASGISAFHIDDNGNTEKLPTSYDASSKRVSFTTTHLSLYAVGYDEALAAPWTNPFLDIKASDWFYGDVEYVHTNGLMNGTGAAAFSPDVKISRAMIVTILYRCEQTPIETVPGTAFTDVPANEWYTDAVAWASANGIVNGIGGNSFAPDDFITRQDLAAIIMRYAEHAAKQFPVTLQYQGFADEAGIAEYAKNAVQTLYCGGIVSGKPGNLFDPAGTATRAEAAALLRRFIEAVD